MTAALAWDGVTVPGRLEAVTVDAQVGELLAIVGPNGAGKTTLLRCALGLVAPTRGEVRVEGRAVAAWTRSERAAAVAWLPQAPRVEEPVAVRELVAVARYRLGESFAAACRAADAALADVGASALAARPVTTLSGGERQRVALASLVAQEARTWLLDEPGNHLDPSVQSRTWAFLASALDVPGRSLVVVTHDLGLLAALPAGRVRVLGLAEGRVAFVRPLADPELPGALSALLGVRVHRLALDGADRLVLGAPS